MREILVCLCLLAAPTADLPALSRDASAAYERAQRALIASDLATAEREITRAIELAPDYPPLYDIYRDTLQTPEQMKAARERYAALVEREPGRLAFWFIHGRLAEAVAERERAFAKVVEIDPKGPWGYFGLAWVARSKEDYDGALALYEKAHAAAPDEPAITSTLVGMLAFRVQTEADSAKTGEWRARATKLFDDRLVEKAPRSYHTYSAYPSMMSISPTKKAVAYAERLVKIFPKTQFIGVAYNVIFADLVTRDEAATVARAKAALANDMATTEVSVTREMLFSDFVFAPTAKTGRAAVDALGAELLASSERSPGIYYTVGARYAVEGDTTLGIKLLARALELSAAASSPLAPPDAIRVALGRTYLRAGDAARAAATLDAVTSAEHVAAAAIGATEAYERLGNATKAYEAIVRAVAVSPTPELEKRLAEAAKTEGKPAEEVTAAVWAVRDTLAKPASDFTLTALDGAPLTLSSRRGKVVLLNFWFPG